MKNDWIIANLNNPDFTAADFKNIGGFTLDNTELLPKSKYLESDKILKNPVFQDESGQFDKNKFDTYYNNQAEKFGNFQHDSNIDNYEYGFWDVFRKPESRVRNPQFTIDKVPNPTHQSWGVLGVNVQGERTKSDRELAEKQKIYDWNEGKFKDETPEDSALFNNPIRFIKNLFSEPLVLAKYEEDTDEINPLTGLLEHHKKGENKTNPDGEYYYETLGERPLIGKEVLSLGDILTKEDSAVNKYDFFDSDDLEKSPEGVIAKNLSAIAPMLFLGPVGTTIYGGMYVARELLKTLPMMERVGTVLSSEDPSENSMLNTLAAYGQKFTGSTSDYSKQKTFSFENFGNLISDVALQWAQQKAIAETITKLSTSNRSMMAAAEGKALAEYEKQTSNILNQAYQGKLSLEEAVELTGARDLNAIKSVIQSGDWKKTLVGNKTIEQALTGIRDSYAKKQKLGQDLSLVYMSMISNTDVYDSMIEHGATKQEAAMVALGSMAGMFGIDKYLGLGEMFFDDVQAQQRRLYRKILKDHYDNDVAPVVNALVSSTEKVEEKKGLMNFFKLGKEKTMEFLRDYHTDIKDRTLGILGKSVGEGLEEVSEELNTDLWKTLYQIAGQFGYVSQTNVGAWDNMRERYLMSLFGGAIGGGIFGGIEAIKNPKTAADQDSREALLTLVRQEGSQNIIKELDRMRDQGKLGSKELSINTQEISQEDGSKQRIFLKADNDNISQNDFNYNQMKTAIQQMEKIINGNQLNISDDKLFERMITSDIKLESLKQQLKDTSYISGYYQDFQKLVSDIYQNESDIEDLRKATDPTKRTDSYEEDLQKLIEKRDELNKRKEDFLTNKTQRYLKKTIFAMNTSISGLFLPVTFEDYVQKEYGKAVRFLSENDKKTAQEKYDSWVKTKKIEDLDKAFDSFEEMTKKVIPTLQELDLADVESWVKFRKQLLEYLPDFDTPLFYDTKIQPLQVDIDESLKKLKIVKGEEYDRPQRDDPTKTNKAFKLQLEEDPNLYFELVRDIDIATGEENGEWSIHFKTGNNKDNYTDLTEDQKQRLFEAASIILPEGAKLSTWGTLTRGGISGIKRFGNFRGFKKTGEREVLLKAGQKRVQIELDESLIPTLEDIKTEKSKEVELPILRGKDGTNENVILNYSIDDNEDITIDILNNNDSFLISKQIIPTDSQLRVSGGNTDLYFDNLRDFGKIESVYRKNGEWYTEVTYSPKDSNEEVTEVFKGLLVPEIVPESLKGDASSALTLGTTYNAEERINIPIWEKNTGETEEEYENRNTPLEGESEEDFQKRKEYRKNLLIQQRTDFVIKSIQNLLNNNTAIDSNTFRYIMANLSGRLKDLKKSYLEQIDSTKNPLIKERIQDSLRILNDNLDNVEDVWNQIESKVLEYTNEQFSQNSIYGELSRISSYEGLKSHGGGIIYFQDLVNFIEQDFAGQIDLDDIALVGSSGGYSDHDLDIHYLADEDLNESREGQAAIDLVNINHALKDNEPVKLHTGYTITYTNESGETITITKNKNDILNPETDKLILEAIQKDIYEDYKPDSKIGYSEDIFNKQLELNKKDLKESFDQVIGALQRDSRYKTLQELQKKLQVSDNPTLKLLNAIASKLGENFGTIEDTLQTIYEQYDGLAEASDFVLNETQIQALEKAKTLLDFATATIVAASGEDSYATPWPYNKTINEWNKEHRSEIDGEIEELPELSQDLANISLSSILQYQAEIDSWIKKAKGNRINKVKMFKEFDVHFEQVKLKFFMDNKDKWITEDGVNLLEGVQEKNNPKDQVLEYERTLYKNVQDLLKNGKNITYIFDTFKESINWEQAATQKTSRLDLNLKELSDYDKFIYISALICQSPDNFYTEYKKFVEENKSSIAPLSFQKHNIRILKAHENNKERFNEFLTLFKKETGLDDLPILENTVISTGIGGSGKTSVCGKAVINKDTWVCGPTETQVNNLKEIKSNLTGYTSKKLLKLILEDQYDEKLGIKKELVSTNNNKHDGGRADISKLEIKSFSNPPSNIILDETTLISNAELQAIAKWCTLNNVQLILIGDENQNGNSEPGNNIARETTIAVRTPKMQLSLRDGNIWKYQNQQTLMNLEDQLRDTDTKEETQIVKNRLINTDLKKFGLKYYFKDGTLSGDMITSTLTEEHLNALPNGKVKFVGSQSSPIYQQLKNAGKLQLDESGNIKAYSLEEIQGQESAYTVADVNWKSLYKANGSAFQLLDFMRNLYTVITRSKEGSIILDNGLSEIIKGGTPQSYSTNSVIIDKDAIKNFSESELNWLNNLTLNPEAEETNVQRGLNEDNVIEAIIPEEDNTNEKDNAEEIQKDNEIIPKDISELPIQVYTNFNYLGINRNDDEVWYNESDSYRDIGIFLRKGTEVSEDKDKRKYSNLLFDLKSFIVYDDIELYNSNASAELKKHFTRKNLRDIKYFIVKEKNDLQKHHLVSEEQGLTEAPEGEELVLLQARLKNKEGKDCIITLGSLPKSSNLHEEFTVEALTKKINELKNSPDNEEEISKIEGIISQLEDGTAAREYQRKLDEEIKQNTEGIYEMEIEKPDFTQICGLSKVRGTDETGKTVYFRVRLSEIGLVTNNKGEKVVSNKSRFGARTSNYIVSPIYVSTDENDSNAGKPFIFVSSRRIYDPSELADRYEENLANGLPADIRKIMLDPAGVSFESLFDERYAQTLITEGSRGKNFTFPFDLLPMGVRMYTALHNFRANLRRFNKAVKDKFGDDLITLEKQLKEESRLFLLYKENNKPKDDEEWVPNEIEYRNWVQSNESLISDGFTLDQIKTIWNFNDNDLQNVKQFRLGYNEKQGVYVRNISNNYLGNYINPQVAKQYQGTVEKIFELVLDQIVPKNSINPGDLVDYRVSKKEFEKIEENWVKHIENSSKVLFNVIDTDENGTATGVVPITIEPKDKLRAIPLLLTMITKNLQARQRMDNPDEVFEGYDNLENKSDYLLTLGNTPISYLKILEGGLGDIRKGRDIEPGVIELEEGQKNSDLRLLNMFNVAFHGTIATGGNDFTKPVSKMHAKDVLFPHGIYVDPILTGKLDRTRKYRMVSTSGKYYLTNVAPSGAKTFVKIKQKSKSTNKKEPKKTVQEIDTISELHLSLNNIVGKEIDLTGTADTAQKLVDKANSEISKDLYENKFSLSGRFTIDELLNLTVSISLNPDGTITENKLKDFEELKQVDNFIEVKKDKENYILIANNGNSYTVSYNGTVKVVRNGQNLNGQFSWSIKDAINKILNFDLLSKGEFIKRFINNKTNSYETPEAFKAAFKTFLQELKRKDTLAYNELIEDLEINESMDNLDDLINTLENIC